MSHLFVLAASLLLSSGVLRDYDRSSSSVGPVLSRGWDATAVERLRSDLPGIVARVATRLDRQFETPMTTVLTPDVVEFRRVVRELPHGRDVSDNVVGVAIPTLHVLVIRGGLSPGALHSFAETLRHEIAHLLIHQIAGVGTRVPRWFDEGLASWASEHRLPPWDEADLVVLARVGGLYDLLALEKEFPPGHRGTSIAYTQSYLLVAFLVECHGERAILDVLASLEHRELREALSELTGETVGDLEMHFSSWLISRRALFWSLLGFVNLWTVAALLAIVAIVRSVLRRRRLLRTLEDEERDHGLSDPSEPVV